MTDAPTPDDAAGADVVPQGSGHGDASEAGAAVLPLADTDAPVPVVELAGVARVFDGVVPVRALQPTDSRMVPVDTASPDAAAGGQTLVRLARPVEAASETVILGTGADAAAAVVDVLVELGVL